MKILAIEPYYGGSHKAFIDNWQRNSCHEFEILTLPANNWKWRMRHSAIYFADLVNKLIEKGGKWDCLFCCDMLNLSEFKGLCEISDIPTIVYFHENQLTYPCQIESKRDYQCVLTNMTSALSADAVWFNSEFHKNDFLLNLKKFLKRMPDYQPISQVDVIACKSKVYYPGIDCLEPANTDYDGPVRILWSGRWEHDKNPEDFFTALKLLKQKGLSFRLNVVGERFREYPAVFDEAKILLADEIDYWGYQKSRKDYIRVLQNSDIVVSTAIHEFYGIAILEAVSAGAWPILPERLSYPEIFAGMEECFFGQKADELARKLENMVKNEVFTKSKKLELSNFTKKYSWQKMAGQMDNEIENSCY